MLGRRIGDGRCVAVLTDREHAVAHAEDVSGRGPQQNEGAGMRNDTTTTEMTVTAEEQALLGRFAARASEAANVPNTDDGGSFDAYVVIVLI
jgi:hypothetical protein